MDNPSHDSRLTSHEIAISVRNLSKKYKLYDSPKHRLKEALNPFRKKYHRDFWALQDINLDIPKGTTFGIIGQNGSGKSTLLQIICGILQPTTGSVQVNGRISALLELGAGFNKEYTGRENVFMQGTIMGFDRQEMKRRFDQIVDFAEIGNFIDQPVKIYSSGMNVRLAFAVAINIDPDILVIDEAMAVGDIKFQRKCFIKIEQFRKEGKSILFVSHSLESVNMFCDTAILVDKGEILDKGEPKQVTQLYQKMMLGENIKRMTDKKNVFQTIDREKREKDEQNRLRSLADARLKTRKAEKKAEIIDCGILDQDGKKVTLLETSEKYTFFSSVIVHTPLKEVHLGYPIKNVRGLILFAVNSDYQQIDVGPVECGDIINGRLRLTMWLAPGNYFISFRTGIHGELYDEVADMHFVVRGSLKINPVSLVNLEAEMKVEKLPQLLI
jgi:teichoic acid transport system ATP-binding protein